MSISRVRRAIRSTAFAIILAAGIAPAALAADYADGNYALNHISLEAAVKVWRQAAWQFDDFLAQVKLGDVYSNSSDSRYYDPVEAYVWYYLATKNRMGRARMWDDDVADVIRGRRGIAIAKQQELLLELSTDQRTEARERITYILSCHGANGFLLLGRISETPHARNDEEEDDDYGRGYDRRGGRRGDRDRPARLWPAALGDVAQRFRRADLFPHRRRDGQSLGPRLSQHRRSLLARQLFRRASCREAGQGLPLLVPALRVLSDRHLGRRRAADRRMHADAGAPARSRHGCRDPGGGGTPRPLLPRLEGPAGDRAVPGLDPRRIDGAAHRQPARAGRSDRGSERRCRFRRTRWA
ncbi:MAG: hypothetical protein WDM81_07910 [Rhizomicrobium sp.]